MDSVWFSIDSDEEDFSDDESNKLFMGCFNQHPKIIASWLPRPKTPIQFIFNNSENIIPNNISQNSAIFRQNLEPKKIPIPIETQFNTKKIQIKSCSLYLLRYLGKICFIFLEIFQKLAFPKIVFLLIFNLFFLNKNLINKFILNNNSNFL